MRPDISPYLIHFTKGKNNPKSENEAFDVLKKIISERKILANEGLIRGSTPCVCFTEAPLDSLKSGFVSHHNYSNYSSFGIRFKKEWLFSGGGRPVIYQPESEFANLPDSLKWRHMRYEPTSTPPIDFTWEREWRIPCNIDFNPDVASIIVPNSVWAEQLRGDHDAERDQERFSSDNGSELAIGNRENLFHRES